MFDRDGYGALVRRKRGDKRLSQENLAADALGDPGRKGDISRIENGKTAPQETTIRKINAELGISDAEMEPIRNAASPAAKLGNLPTLSRDDLELLASRFEIEKPHDRTDAALRELLSQKAEEYRSYRAQIDAIDDRVASLHNLKAAAQGAAERLDLDEVEMLLARVDEVETEIVAESKELRARNALLRNRPEEAYQHFSAAADAFANVDRAEQVARCTRFGETLRQHGARYGGASLVRAKELITHGLAQIEQEEAPLVWAYAQDLLAGISENMGTRAAGPEGAALLAEAVEAYRAALRVLTEADRPLDWASTMQNLAIALQTQGTRTAGPEGAALLAEAVNAYRAALRVFTEDDHPVDWAMTLQNLAIALQAQGTRTAGPEGAALLAEAVNAYRAALRVFTEDHHPVDWAMTLQNLAIALEAQGTRTAGPEGAALLEEAADAYRAALRVFTEVDHPVDWARAQQNMALLEHDRAAHHSCPDPRAALEAALVHVEAALRVYDPEHMPYDHGRATALREKIRAALAAL